MDPCKQDGYLGTVSCESKGWLDIRMVVSSCANHGSIPWYSIHLTLCAYTVSTGALNPPVDGLSLATTCRVVANQKPWGIPVGGGDPGHKHLAPWVWALAGGKRAT